MNILWRENGSLVPRVGEGKTTRQTNTWVVVHGYPFKTSMMQGTLFKFGITKKIQVASGRTYDVTSSMPMSATTSVNAKAVQCIQEGICKCNFTTQQYLDIHLHWKHKDSTPVPEETVNRPNVSKSHPVYLVDTEQSDAVDRRDGSGDCQLSQVSQIQKPRRNNQKGSPKRKSYTLEFKWKALKLLDQMTKEQVKNRWQKVASTMGIPHKCLVVKWNKERLKIKDEMNTNKVKKGKANIVAARQRRKITSDSIEQREKFPLAAKLVVSEFKRRRQQGIKVSKLWLCKKMKCKVEQLYGANKASSFKASRNWFQRFKKRHQISLWNRTNKKNISSEDCRETIQMFHRSLRKSLKTSRQRNANAHVDPKWGRWLPENRYNVDQVPLPFVVNHGQTYADKGSKQVWVSQPTSGLDKRQATLQLCIRGSGKQPVKPAIVFRGKGNVAQDEKSQYDSRIDIYFQKNAWMDCKTNREWTERTLMPGIEDKKNENVLFADNVSFQTEKVFHETCREKCNTIVYMLPDSQTDKVQPIDAGIGRMFKKKMEDEMDKWLDDEDNIEKWHDKISARQRPILMTRWAGQAWEELQKYEDIFKKSFERTGCLLTIDGSDDQLIKPQGLENYTF